MHDAPRPPDNDPIDDLDKGDDAEAKKEAKESAERCDELYRSHPDAPLIIWEEMFYILGYWLPPMTVSLPKKMLTTAMSSSHAL